MNLWSVEHFIDIFFIKIRIVLLSKHWKGLDSPLIKTLERENLILMKKMSMKCSTDQRFIQKKNTSYKHHTLKTICSKKTLRYKERIESYWKSIKTYRVHYAQLVGRRTDRSVVMYYVCIALYNSIATYSTVKYISSQSLTTTYILHSSSKQGLVT